MPCIVLYSIVLYWTSPNLWFAMSCIVFYCIILTSPNMAQSHQDSLSWLCLHLLLINCVSVLVICMYCMYMGASVVSLTKFEKTHPTPSFKPFPFRVPVPWVVWLSPYNIGITFDMEKALWQSYQCWEFFFGYVNFTGTQQNVCIHAGPLVHYV